MALFGRVNYATSNTAQRGATILPGFSFQPAVNPNVTQSLNVLTSADADTMTLTGGVTFSFSSRTINDLRVNFSRCNRYYIFHA